MRRNFFNRLNPTDFLSFIPFRWEKLVVDMCKWGNETWGFHNRWEIYWSVKLYLAPQEELFFTELITKFTSLAFMGNITVLRRYTSGPSRSLKASWKSFNVLYDWRIHFLHKLQIFPWRKCMLTAAALQVCSWMEANPLTINIITTADIKTSINTLIT
jgi:hypothetical protein